MTNNFSSETVRTRALRFLWNASGRRLRVGGWLSRGVRDRQPLPELTPAEAIRDFEGSEIRLTHCPVGSWSSPLVDVLLVLKCAVGFQAKNILELGSFRGETARLLAENTADDARGCAVDIDERHGSAYAGTAAASKIRRVTASIEPGLFAPDEKFDLIFVDALHDFQSVVDNSLLAFDWLAPDGVILWHDYYLSHNYFYDGGGVMEALAVCSRKHPIAALTGSHLAMHSRRPGWETASLLARKSSLAASPAVSDVWQDIQMRR